MTPRWSAGTGTINRIARDYEAGEQDAAAHGGRSFAFVLEPVGRCSTRFEQDLASRCP